MTDDASANGNQNAPDQGSAPPPPPRPAPDGPDAAPQGPDRTVVRPRDPVTPEAVTAAQDDPRDPPSGSSTAVLVDNAPAPTPGETGGGGTHPPATGALDPDFPTKAGRGGATSMVIPIGVGLLAAAIVISALRSRASDSGDLDWSNFGIGLGAVAVLLVIALLGASGARRTGGRAREDAVTWPGVVGILGTGVMITVGVESGESWLGYVVGGVIAVLAAIGYLLARRPAFTLTGLAGLLLIYGVLFDDLIAEGVNSDDAIAVGATAVAVFVLGASLLGWLLPGRAVTGVALGVFAVVVYVGMLTGLIVLRYLGDFFTGFMAMGSEEPGADVMDAGAGFAESEVWWILGYAALFTVLWAAAAAVTNHSGFSILAIVMPALTVPLATVALAAEHPSRWSAIVAAAGGVLLLGGLLLARNRRQALEREPSVGTYD